MIQKKSLKDAIQNPEIISVVGGLIGKATSSKDGLLPKTLSCISNISSKIIKIKFPDSFTSWSFIVSGSYNYSPFLYIVSISDSKGVLISNNINNNILFYIANDNTNLVIYPKSLNNCNINVGPLTNNRVDSDKYYSTEYLDEFNSDGYTLIS